MSDVLERFLRYVKVGSPSNPENAQQTPSTPEQHKMAELLEAELKELGLEDVERNDLAYVTASLPATPDAMGLPALGLIAHVDSSYSVPGLVVNPQVVAYEGGNLCMSDEVFITPEECPDLASFAGKDIVCSDGTSLLSADDKAGVAEIMALLARLVADKSLSHPTLKVAFVPDEEIGHGARLLELHDFGATWAYTVDGEALGQVSYETFNAAHAVVTIHGKNVHPGSAKNIMVNAITLSRQFDSLIPAWERPEHTEHYEGYYHCNGIQGNESEVRMNYILRDHDGDILEQRKERMRAAAAFINAEQGMERVEVDIRDEYRNMAEALVGLEFLVDNAMEANRAAGIEPFIEEIRGGTDGSQLTLRGLPCPNLATGGYNAHSVREFIPVENLEKSVDMLEKLVALFAVKQG